LEKSTRVPPEKILPTIQVIRLQLHLIEESISIQRCYITRDRWRYHASHHPPLGVAQTSGKSPGWEEHVQAVTWTVWRREFKHPALFHDVRASNTHQPSLSCARKAVLTHRRF